MNKLKKLQNSIFAKVLIELGIILYDAFIAFLASLIAALFFFYAFGPGGFYLLCNEIDAEKGYIENERKQKLDVKFGVYLIMTVFNILCWVLTIYLILKAAR